MHPHLDGVGVAELLPAGGSGLERQLPDDHHTPDVSTDPQPSVTQPPPGQHLEPERAVAPDHQDVPVCAGRRPDSTAPGRQALPVAELCGRVEPGAVYDNDLVPRRALLPVSPWVKSIVPAERPGRHRIRSFEVSPGDCRSEAPDGPVMHVPAHSTPWPAQYPTTPEVVDGDQGDHERSRNPRHEKHVPDHPSEANELVPQRQPFRPHCLLTLPFLGPSRRTLLAPAQR